MKDVPAHIRDQAEAIANQAQALADGRVAASLASKAKLIRDNADALLAWCEQADSAALIEVER